VAAGKRQPVQPCNITALVGPARAAAPL